MTVAKLTKNVAIMAVENLSRDPFQIASGIER
jgi:hypothetical protein